MGGGGFGRPATRHGPEGGRSRWVRVSCSLSWLGMLIFGATREDEESRESGRGFKRYISTILLHTSPSSPISSSLPPLPHPTCMYIFFCLCGSRERGACVVSFVVLYYYFSLLHEANQSKLPDPRPRILPITISVTPRSRPGVETGGEGGARVETYIAASLFLFFCCCAVVAHFFFGGRLSVGWCCWVSSFSLPDPCEGEGRGVIDVCMYV